MLSEQSTLLNQATTPFMSHFTVLKLLPQTKKALTQARDCAKKNIFIVNIVRRASPWLLDRAIKNGNLVHRTLPIVRGRNWRIFFFFFFPEQALLTACALLFACDVRWSNHKLRPPLKYSEEQMVLKHDCSPPPTHAELR